MFDRDYTLNGSHATKLKFLVKRKSEDKDTIENPPYYFKRYIDVYMNAVVFGLLYNRRANEDDKLDRARIYADAFAGESNKCNLLFKLVMLLDESTQLRTEERLDRAFRYASSGDNNKIKECTELFHSYMRGGIDVLYEKLTVGCIGQDDYNKRAIELMKSFDEEFNGEDVSAKLKKILHDEE